jgi:hypothetical protein
LCGEIWGVELFSGGNASLGEVCFGNEVRRSGCMELSV